MSLPPSLQMRASRGKCTQGMRAPGKLRVNRRAWASAAWRRFTIASLACTTKTVLLAIAFALLQVGIGYFLLMDRDGDADAEAAAFAIAATLARSSSTGMHAR